MTRKLTADLDNDSLITLLIVANFVRAMAYLPYSLLTFRYGVVESNTDFCQASGFFIALGTQAAGTSPDALRLCPLLMA